MQPLFSYECLFDSSSTQSHSMSRRIGWQFAYEQFKRKSDRVTRAFSPTRSSNNVNNYAPWVIASIPYGFLNQAGRANSFLRTGFDLEPYDLMVSPTDLNACMVVPFTPYFPLEAIGDSSDDHKPWLIYQTDPFICDFNLYVKKVNGMSEYGEPEL